MSRLGDTMGEKLYLDRNASIEHEHSLRVLDTGDGVSLSTTIVIDEYYLSVASTTALDPASVVRMIKQMTAIATARKWMIAEQRSCDTPAPATAQFLVDAAAEADMDAEDERYAASLRARAMLTAALGMLVEHMRDNGEEVMRYETLAATVDALRAGSAELDVKLAALPPDQRDAWDSYQRDEGAFLRLLPHNGFDCYADTHGGTCGHALLIDGSCPNSTEHLAES